MTKEIKYEVKKVLNTIEIGYGVYCFQLLIYIDDKIQSIQEGFTKNLELTSGEMDIKHNICLFKKEVLDVNLNNVGGYYSINCDEQKKYIVENPYTYITTHKDWEENYLVIDYYVLSGDLKKLDGSYYPKAVAFSELSGLMDNEHYDLESVLECIKTNDRCVLISDGIKDIPWYNRVENCDQYISFIYKPTEEQYNEVKNEEEYPFWDIHTYVAELLGLDKFRKRES